MLVQSRHVPRFPQLKDRLKRLRLWLHDTFERLDGRSARELQLQELQFHRDCFAMLWPSSDTIADMPEQTNEHTITMSREGDRIVARWGSQTANGTDVPEVLRGLATRLQGLSAGEQARIYGNLMPQGATGSGSSGRG